MKKLSVIILILVSTYVLGYSQQLVTSTGRFHAVLGSPLQVTPEGTDGSLGTITPGSVKDLKTIPVEQRSVEFVVNGTSGMNFNAGGIVEEISDVLQLSEIVWEYFDFGSNTWIRFSINDNGDFESSMQEFQFNENGVVKLRVYPNRMSASGNKTGQQLDHGDIYFDVTLSCFYSEI